MDRQLIRALFANTAEAARILGRDRPACGPARLALLRREIMPNRIGRHGQLQAWTEDWDDPEDPLLRPHWQRQREVHLRARQDERR
jgi:alpha-L-fucosidase 2